MSINTRVRTTSPSVMGDTELKMKETKIPSFIFKRAFQKKKLRRWNKQVERREKGFEKREEKRSPPLAVCQPRTGKGDVGRSVRGN